MGKFYGVDGLGGMLKALSGDPSGYAALQGVLIVADFGDDAQATFRRVCRSINRHGPFDANAQFNRPTAACRVTAQPQGHPSISIMLVPLAAIGGLETICAQAMFQTKPWLRACVEAYLDCGHFTVADWPAERRGKAMMQCIIAALYKNDPNKPLAQLLALKRSVIDFRARNFTPLVRYVRRFCHEVNAI